MEKAALSLAIAAISPIFTKLNKEAAAYFGGDVTSKELDEFVTIILPRIKVVINAGLAVNEDDLKLQLMKLKDAAHEAEDLLDEYEYMNIQSEVSPPLVNTLKNLKDNMKEIFGPVLLKTKLNKGMEEVREHAAKADKLVPIIGLLNKTTAPRQDNMYQQPETTVSITSSPVFGRDEELNSLINKSIEVRNGSTISNNIYVHAICGIGGAGKTTFAQYFYNHERVEKDLQFDLKIWIHVSQTFDTFKITKEIIESEAQGEKSPVGNLDVLQRLLMQKLQSKKFLLVLDDIWCAEKEIWDRFLIPLNKVKNIGSMVLITTRMDRVTSKLGITNVLQLKELATTDCLSIMKYYAFGDAKKQIKNRNLKSEMKKIVGRSKNSPLAARIIGRSQWQKMNVDEWRKLFNDDMLKGVMDALLLSFQHLPSHLQQCFAFCSLYPKGHQFHNKDVEELVRFWIAHGFVEAPINNQSTLEDVGRKYFEELLSYSFFQVHEYGNDHHVYVIHDLLHDLADEVSKDQFLRIEGDGPETIPKTIMHISIASKKLVHIPNIFKLKNLRTFIIFFASNDDIGDITKKGKTMYEKLRKLRVLCFGSFEMQEILICQLKHLRYLQVSGVRKLPKALGNLYHLLFLDLPKNSIKEVPNNFNNLVKLRRLVGCENHNYVVLMASKISKLTSLQELQVYHVNKNTNCDIGQLKNMSQLRGSLQIGKLENVRKRAQATAAKLNDKIYLEELILSWSSESKRDPKDDEEVLEGLKPHPNLEKLEINGFQGAKLPKWWMLNDEHCLAKNLQSLKLYSCPNLMVLPSLPHSLKTLHILNCSNLMKAVSLPHDLSELVIEGCPKLKQLPLLPCSLKDNVRITCSGIEKLLWSAFNDDDDDDDDEEEEDKGKQQQHQNHEGSNQASSLQLHMIRNLPFLDEKAVYDFLAELQLMNHQRLALPWTPIR